MFLEEGCDYSHKYAVKNSKIPFTSAMWPFWLTNRLGSPIEICLELLDREHNICFAKKRIYLIYIANRLRISKFMAIYV
jgi:hypothetical protein